MTRAAGEIVLFAELGVAVVLKHWQGMDILYLLFVAAPPALRGIDTRETQVLESRHTHDPAERDGVSRAPIRNQESSGRPLAMAEFAIEPSWVKA